MERNHWLKALGHARGPLPPRSITRQSHTRLRPEQYDLALDALASVAASP